MNTTKKAQFELIGLAIIIMLVLLGMFVAIRFQISRPIPRIESRYSQTQLASNFLNTLLSTNTNCSDRLVRELLIDCAGLKIIDCVEQTPSKKSCEKVAEILDTYVLPKTLTKWNQKYILNITKGASGTPPDVIIGRAKDCTLSMPREMPGIYYYSLEGGRTLTIRLDLCS